MANGHDIKDLIDRINRLGKSLDRLKSRKDFIELIKIMKRPGWTTPAEFLFSRTIVDSMQAQVNALVQLQQDFVKAAKEVREI